MPRICPPEPSAHKSRWSNSFYPLPYSSKPLDDERSCKIYVVQSPASPPPLLCSLWCMLWSIWDADLLALLWRLDENVLGTSVGVAVVEFCSIQTMPFHFFSIENVMKLSILYKIILIITSTFSRTFLKSVQLCQVWTSKFVWSFYISVPPK